MKKAFAFFAACALLIVGCSGGGPNEDFRGDVTGIIFDETGVPVRDAHVYFDGPDGIHRDCQSNSNGVYLITDIPIGNQIIRVEYTQGGTRYFGSNVAPVDHGQKAMNVNIAVYRDDRLGSIEGFVYDRSGFRLKGARVFVKQVTSNTVLSSSYGITGDDGHYVVGALRANMQYDVQVNGLDYNSDFDSFTLTPGETRRLDFTLPAAEDITLSPPTNVVVTAWTSPPVTRDAETSSAYENIKHIVKPKYKPRASQTRGTPGGGIIEIDTTWDPIFDNALLGFGIYRSEEGGTFRDVNFLRDPLAEIFADMDDNLRVGRSYGYRVTTITSANRESPFSDAAFATPLGDLALRDPQVSNHPTFRWMAAEGADTYTIYLFDRFPGIGVTQLWDNETDPAFGTTYTYNGGSLGPGTYYYIIVGASNAGNYTLSPVGQFTL